MATSRTGRTKKTGKSDGVDFGLGKDGLDIGIDFKGFKASISTSGILKLGIGIAAVELNLKDPNESKVSYGFGIYEIEGKREGCTVELIYSIAGEEVKRETRKVPECEEEEGVGEDPDRPPEPTTEIPLPIPDETSKELDTNIICWALFRRKVIRVLGREFGPALDLDSSIKRVFLNHHRGIRFRNWIVEHKTTSLFYFEDGSWTSGFNYYDVEVDLVIKNKTEGYWVINNGWTKKEFYPDNIAPKRTDENEDKFTFGVGVEGKLPTGIKSASGDFGMRAFFFITNTGENIKKRVAELHEEYASGEIRAGYATEYATMTLGYIFKPKGYLEDSPPSFIDKRKSPMNENCCAMIERIYEALDVDELLDEEVKIPNRLIASGGSGVKKYNTYLKLMEVLIREVDLTGIHPFKAKVTDVNAAQTGDQSVEIEFSNATAAVKQIAELLLENKGDSATRLNLMMRTAIATGQILNVVSIVAKNVENLINFIGMPVQEKIKYVKMPFDFTFGKRKEQKGKGFGKPSGASQSGIDALDINTEEATEALLPKFMQDEEQPIVYKQFKPKQPDLIDIIKEKK